MEGLSWAASVADIAVSTLAEIARNPDGVEQAAQLIAESLVAGGVLQVFGTGHSQGTAMEFAGRAGGLIPTNRISLADLAVFGDEPVQSLHDVLLERTPGLATRLLDLTRPAEQDVFVIISNSGINAAVVDMAIEVKRRGHGLVALTSASASQRLESRHTSGTRLIDHADVVLDNRAPDGDAVLDIGSDQRICAVSSLTGALLAQMVVAATAQILVAAGHSVPAYVSANVPGGHERNLLLEQKYTGRIRRSAL